MSDWEEKRGSGDWGHEDGHSAPDRSPVNGDCNECGHSEHPPDGCPNSSPGQDKGNDDDDRDKCFGCGETGHRRADCPTAGEMLCRYCKEPGHMIKDCPQKPPMVCDNCGDEGHMRKDCEKPRKINRDHVADVELPEALNKIKLGAAEREVEDVKEGVQEYVKATQGEATYRDVQEVLIENSINLWFIALEKPNLATFTNMDLQGNMEKKYTISYRFSEKPERPREREGWPETREEILERLEDAGDVVSNGKSQCSNCKQVGHTSKYCPEEKVENLDAPKVFCPNCNEDGHRIRDCPIPRVDKFACKNCGKSGHKVAECEEPPNPENVECRKCGEKGHFARDCPQGGGSRACRNCGNEGHIAKDCEEPLNMDNITCRNCEKTGHFSRDCREPKDWSKVKCSNCEEYGHTKVRCNKQPADSYEDGNGDAGNGDTGNDDANHHSGHGYDGAHSNHGDDFGAGADTEAHHDNQASGGDDW